MKDLWVKNDNNQLKDLCCGTTVLIKLKCLSKGITCEGGHTVDISWIRNNDFVVATDGNYTYDEISDFQEINL